jgi:hypothetical protein
MSTGTAFLALDDGFTSAIGHQGTVDVLKTIFPAIASQISLNRIEIKEPADQIVFKLKARLPEGKVLTATEIEQIGYEFWEVTPVKERMPVAPAPDQPAKPVDAGPVTCPRCACGYIYPPEPIRKSPAELRQERDDEHSRVMF